MIPARLLGVNRESRLRHFRRFEVTVVALITVLAVIGSGHARAQASPPVVVFQLGDAGDRAAADRCAQAWREFGVAMTAELVPEIAALDTVVCAVLPTAAFRAHFAGALPDWGVGVAIPPGRFVAVDDQRSRATGPGVGDVFLHEMVHALLMQGSQGVRLPTWLHEGAAMRWSGQWRWTDTVQVIFEGDLPSLDRLQGAFPGGLIAADRAYRTSLLAVNALVKRHGSGVVARIVSESARRGDFDAGFAAATGEDLDRFEQEFAASMRLRFGWGLALVRWPTLFVFMAVLVLVGALRRRWRDRRRLRAMDDEA